MNTILLLLLTTFGFSLTGIVLADIDNGSALPVGCVLVCLCVCDIGVLWLNA